MYLCPRLPGGGCDTGAGDDGFTRDFQTFFSVIIFSTVYFFIYLAMKKKETSHTEDELVKMIVCALAFYGTYMSLALFGPMGFNPIIATVNVIFVVSQTDGQASDYAHYLWAYMIGPLVAAFLGAILHLLHFKVSNKQGGDTYD